MRAAFACVALALAAACTADEPGYQVPPQLAGLPKSEVEVRSRSGTHRFQVWIAADAGSRERGLMFVREMPEDHGMLFLFERAQYTSFWMEKTYLSLDLLFIAEGWVVARIAPAAEPMSLTPIDSEVPVIAVLEVAAGTAARLGIQAGDLLTSPALPAMRRP